MIRVLFVCLGNICRSTMAEAVFQHQVKAAGLEHEIEADSAGTGDWHVGEPPHPGTTSLLERQGISYQHLARQITKRDLETFDYLLTMDTANRRGIERLGRGRAQVAPLLTYAPESSVTEVPDPYYTGNFEEVYEMVSEATAGLLAAIRAEHHL